MEFNKKIEAFQKMLFSGYVRGDKITVSDWYDESVELSTLITKPDDVNVIGEKISTYLENTFPDDAYKNFPMLGHKMAETILPHLQ